MCINLCTYIMYVIYKHILSPLGIHTLLALISICQSSEIL